VSTQNYANHRRAIPLFFALALLIVLTLIGACVNLYLSIGDHQRLYSAALLVAVMIALALLFVFCRAFPLKAQDRAIRAEEGLRHFSMTGKLLDPRLSIKQIVALRFASDGEFVALARRAAEEHLEPNAIKKAIKQWRADEYRV
jgi:cytochrome c biogenesis protein CcdA